MWITLHYKSQHPGEQTGKRTDLPETHYKGPLMPQREIMLLPSNEGTAALVIRKGQDVDSMNRKLKKLSIQAAERKGLDAEAVRTAIEAKVVGIGAGFSG